MLKKRLNIIYIIVLVGLLVAIRAFEDDLFYDPLIHFFKTDHSTQPLPSLDVAKLLGHTAFRFLLNTLISLGIIWFVFKSKEIVKMSALLYIILFCILFILFYALIVMEAGSHLPLFYVRRFLIQPLLLLLLLPAFYFQKISKGKQ